MKTLACGVRSSILAAVLVSGCASHKEAALQTFIDNHVAKVRPLAIQSNLADWEAATTGKPEAYDKAGKLRLQIRQVYSDANDYAYLKSAKASGQVKDPLLARQLTCSITPIWRTRSSRTCSSRSSSWAPEIEKNFSTLPGAT